MGQFCRHHKDAYAPNCRGNSKYINTFEIVLGQTQFVGLKFWIFGGFGRVRSLVLVDKPEFKKVRSSVFPDLGLGLDFSPFPAEQVRSLGFLEGFKVRFW